ncbi:GGDEF domain-containing protein [Thiosulfativibrio zosterae]|uniref:diguanylate cyclase n=1 Tax=Thiosulfativibrio zosterae TaxID=2675053 RepID=A0A6F8PQ96_9GAMM|nr:GGDEF domain-containing protein [Thiosulfativibrio zosterae]BBP44256.1 GGDEF domain-containing protein [Thiosulfativibrio zosterae]
MLRDFKDAPEKAKRIFMMLQELFEEQNINPHPLNYYIWYSYYKGDNPKFRQEMDRVLNDPFGYNDRIGKRLYEEYLEDQDNSDNQFDSAFKRLIGLMIQKMNLWSDRLEEHTKELDACATSLSGDPLNAEELKKLTNSVLSTANSMQQSTAEFQKELLESTKEVQDLRQQLIEARAEIMQDELTQVGNRKAFNNAIEELTTEAMQAPQTLCLIMTDIDHFKRFNDTFGHLVGDSVLRYFANVMKKGKQENETICRYGGEEFAILLANSSLEAAKARAEAVRSGIESAQLKRANSEQTLGKITASFGISVYQGPKESVESFIKRADDALYLAKDQGRNQVKTELDIPVKPA